MAAHYSRQSFVVASVRAPWARRGAAPPDSEKLDAAHDQLLIEMADDHPELYIPSSVSPRLGGLVRANVGRRTGLR